MNEQYNLLERPILSRRRFLAGSAVIAALALNACSNDSSPNTPTPPPTETPFITKEATPTTEDVAPTAEATLQLICPYGDDYPECS